MVDAMSISFVFNSKISPPQEQKLIFQKCLPQDYH